MAGRDGKQRHDVYADFYDWKCSSPVYHCRSLDCSISRFNAEISRSSQRHRIVHCSSDKPKTVFRFRWVWKTSRAALHNMSEEWCHFNVIQLEFGWRCHLSPAKPLKLQSDVIEADDLLAARVGSGRVIGSVTTGSGQDTGQIGWPDSSCDC